MEERERLLSLMKESDLIKLWTARAEEFGLDAETLEAQRRRQVEIAAEIEKIAGACPSPELAAIDVAEETSEHSMI